MSKKLKILIGTVIAILAIGLFFGIATIIRFSKIENIVETVNRNIEKDNYYIKTIATNNEETKITETYYKNGIGKLVFESGLYTWVSATDEKAYLINEETKNAQEIEPEGSLILISNEMFASLYPFYNESIFQRFMFAGNLRNTIKTENLDGEECTVIVVEKDNVTRKYWISKKFNNLLRTEVEFPNGEKYEYEYEIKFHIVKLKDTELPDLTEYKITLLEAIGNNKEENIDIEATKDTIETKEFK